MRASYYLTKPLDYQRVCQALDAACAGLQRDSRCLEVRSSGISTVVLLRNILFMDCSAERPRLHLVGQLLRVDGRAGDLLEQLCDDERFLCCNRNVVVNMDQIELVQEGDFLLRDGQTVPIRQRGRAQVKRQFLQYSLKSLRREETE